VRCVLRALNQAGRRASVLELFVDGLPHEGVRDLAGRVLAEGQQQPVIALECKQPYGPAGGTVEPQRPSFLAWSISRLSAE